MGRGAAGGSRLCGGSQRLGCFAAQAGEVNVVFGVGAFERAEPPLYAVRFGFDGQTGIESGGAIGRQDAAKFGERRAFVGRTLRVTAEPVGDFGGTGGPIKWRGEDGFGIGFQDAAHFAEKAQRGGDAVEHVEGDSAIEIGGGEGERGNVRTPEADVPGGKIGDRIVDEIEGEADAAAGVAGTAGPADFFGDAEHGEVEIDADGEVPRGGGELECAAADRAADVEPEALRGNGQKAFGGVEDVEQGRRVSSPVRVGVDAIVAAFAVMRGTGAGQIAEDGFGEVRKIAAAENVGELVLDPGCGVGQENGDAVDDGMLALAHSLGAQERAFEDVVSLLAGNAGDSQHGDGLVVDPTERADRLDAFAVFETQGELSANDDVG